MNRKSFTLLISFLICILFLLTTQRVLAADPEKIARILRSKGLNPLIVTGILSMLPVFELRGSIPVGIALLGQRPLYVFLVAVFFNLIPVLPIIFLLIPFRNFLISKGILSGFFIFLEKRAFRNRKIVERYGEWGLALFVAVPLPVTGAWTGSIIAAFLGLPVFKSFIFISLGVFTAGIIVTVITLLGMKSLLVIIPILSGLMILVVVKMIYLIKRRSDEK